MAVHKGEDIIGHVPRKILDLSFQGRLFLAIDDSQLHRLEVHVTNLASFAICNRWKNFLLHWQNVAVMKQNGIWYVRTSVYHSSSNSYAKHYLEKVTLGCIELK